MTTQLIRSTYNIRPAHLGGVVTLGNFDGVHVGHQQLIKKVVEKAKALGVPSGVITFEPHPFEFFTKEHLTIPRITRLREKFYWLKHYGVDNVLILPFNQKLANLSATDFVKQILVDALKVRHVIVGDDFHFGHDRLGDAELLKKMGEQFGFSVESVGTVLVNGERVSSTRVRKSLQEGDHQLLKQLLARPFTMLGRVQHGDQRGRQWGFPTANIYLHRKLTPIRGVYLVYMHGIAPHPWPGVANVGVRPTVDGTRILLEVHLLNFNESIYGRYVQVEFLKKLRDEVRFPSLDLLKEQIAKDVLDAKNYFEK